jgi:hypothetical protein
MEQRTGLRAGRRSEPNSKLLIFGFWTRAQVLVQSGPGAIAVCGWEVSERYAIRDLKIQHPS